MCHNLGADETKDPFKPAAEIHGAMYQFGIGTEALSQADNLSNSGTVPGWNNSVPGSGDWNMVTKNPCPTGWRLPTKDEWQGVIDNNNKYRTANGGTSWSTSTLSWSSGATVFGNGIKFGDALVLPTVGLRFYTNGSLYERGAEGYYWCSTAEASSGYNMIFRGYDQYVNYNSRSYGMSVRCISE
jgi:uncharacterized protein (TIGR02145 family)